MGIFSWLIGSKEKHKKTVNNVINVSVPNFTNLKSVRENDVFMSAVLCNARHTSKISVKHFYNGEPKKDSLTSILNVRPNRIMNSATFWEKARIKYDCDTNVFIYIDWKINPNTLKLFVNSLWILEPNNIQVTHDNNMIWYSFNVDGKQITCDESYMAVISKNVDLQEMFGDGNNSIAKTLKVIDTNYQGVEKAIKSSAYIRFILQTTTLMSDEKKKEKGQAFSEAMLNADNNGTGIAVIDGGENLTQINSKADYVKYEELKEFQDNLYKYLGVNEEILKAKADDKTWQSYYESTIEPFLIKVQQELTYKLFNKNERDYGNEIRIEDNRLQNLSLDTRLKIAERIQLMPKYSPNMVLDLLYLPKIEGGDTLYENLNYQNVKGESSKNEIGNN